MIHLPDSVPVLRARLLAAAALVLGLALTAWAVQATYEARQTEAHAQFVGHVNRLEVEVQRRINRAAYGLKGARAAYAVARQPLNRAQFTDYVGSRQILSEFPGIRGFGFIERVERDRLPAFEAAERADNAPEFAVRSSGSLPDLFVIKFIEPLGTNRAALGFDVGSEPVRREAAQRAVDTGADALTGRVTLVQDEQQGAGWLLFVPVYRPGTDAQSVTGRRAQLVGLAYAPIIAAEVLQGAKEIVASEIEFRLFDGAPANGHLLYDSEGRVDPRQPVVAPQRHLARMFHEEREVQVGGRTLVLQAASAPSLEAATGGVMPLLVGVMGVFLSVLLATSAWLLMHARERALWLARRMTSDLERMSKVVERTANAVFGTDAQERITWINQGFTRVTGYTQAEAVGRTANELLRHPDASAEAHARLRQAVEQGNGARVELLNRRKDGSDYWVEVEIQPTRDAAGRVTGYIELGLDITQRKQAERQLAANEAFLEQAERIAGVGGWELDLATGQLRITPQMRRIFGLADDAAPSVEDFLGFFGDNQRDLIERTTQDCVRTGRPWDLELQVVARSGARLWVRTVGSVIQEAGRSVRLVGILQDVTERRVLEEELRLNNARLQTVMENLPCGMSVFDGDLNLVAHNTKFRTLLGFPDQLFAGRQVMFEDIIRYNASRGEYGHEDVEARVQEIIDRARRPEPHRFERRRPNGTQLEVRGAPMPGGGFVTTYVDVTDRKRAEDALRASEDLMRIVTDNIPGRVVYWDSDLRCKFVNRGYCEMQAKSRDQMLGREIVEIIGREQFEELEPHIDGVLAGAAQQFERLERRPDGREVTTLLHYIPDTQNGQVRGFFVLALDITEIREARDMALQASLAKSQFLANMSHEIRTPMNAILGMLSLLKTTALDARQLDYANKTEGAARSLLGLLNDILDFSKVEAGKMTLDPHPFSLDELLRDLSVILSANIGTKNVEVLFDVDPAIPARLLGDDMRLRQVLINLTGNAIKFTHEGEVVVQIRQVRQTPGEVTLDISVRDTGIGIAPENQARIFSGFSQAEASTTRRFGGTGLGLAISQRLVDLMGGRLQLESAPGQGSRFFFEVTFPVVAPARQTVHPADPMVRRVLFIDDNPAALKVLQGLAASLGWEADLASSGEEALARLQSFAPGGAPYDALFVDWRMPGMDGWETSQRIRQLAAAGKAPLLVMVTAHGRETLAHRSPQDQALLDGFLVKPVTASMLTDAVREALGLLPAGTAVSVPGAAAQPLAGLRLLVVEDNANNQQVARELLVSQGAEVDIAVDGRQGVDRVLAAQPAYDLVLMDMQMPVMDGFEATRVLRKEHGLQALPIIAMTANAMASDREDCLAAGMNDHVGKPFELAALVATVLRHTARKPAEIAHREPVAEPALDAPQGIDVDGAVARLGGNLALYLKLGPAFCEDIRQQATRLQAHTLQGDRASALRVLHTLKGLGGTMGAMELARVAAAAEAAWGSSPGTDAERAAQVTQAIDRAAQQVQAVLQTHQSEKREEEGVAPPASTATPGLQALLRDLLGLLEASDMAALEAHARLLDAATGQPAGGFSRLNEAMDAFDFDRAAAECRALLAAPVIE